MVESVNIFLKIYTVTGLCSVNRILLLCGLNGNNISRADTKYCPV